MAAGEVKILTFVDGVTLTQAGTPSAGGGGGAGAVWNAGDPSALAGVENDEKVWYFTAGDNQSIVLWLKVPDSYVTGTPITMNVSHYNVMRQVLS